MDVDLIGNTPISHALYQNLEKIFYSLVEKKRNKEKVDRFLLLNYFCTLKTIGDEIRTDMQPMMRHYHASTSHNGSIYIFGGCYYEFSYNDLFVFKDDKWTKLFDPKREPLNTVQCSITYYNDEMIILGGRDNIYVTSDAYSSLWRFNLKNSTWKEQKGYIKSYLHTSSLNGSDLWSFGGFDGENWNFLSKIDLINGEIDNYDLNGVISPRYGHSMICLHEKLYIFGGGNGACKNLDDLWVYDIRNNFSNQIRTDILSRDDIHMSILFHNDCIYLSNLDVITILDADKFDIKSTIKSLEIGLYSTFCILDDTIHLFGGRQSTVERKFLPFHRQIILKDTK